MNTEYKLRALTCHPDKNVDDSSATGLYSKLVTCSKCKFV